MSLDSLRKASKGLGEKYKQMGPINGIKNNRLGLPSHTLNASTYQ